MCQRLTFITHAAQPLIGSTARAVVPDCLITLSPPAQGLCVLCKAINTPRAPFPLKSIGVLPLYCHESCESKIMQRTVTFEWEEWQERTRELWKIELRGGLKKLQEKLESVKGAIRVGKIEGKMKIGQELKISKRDFKWIKNKKWMRQQGFCKMERVILQQKQQRLLNK